MIHLYPLEEHPHFCSFYWGGTEVLDSDSINGNINAAVLGGSNGSSSSFSSVAQVAASAAAVVATAGPGSHSLNYDGTLRSGLYEDPRIENLRKISYGIALPIICALGIVGNVLNLVVLTRRNMRGTAYIYMRGYSAAALLAIIFAIPFGMRMLIHRDSGRWRNFGQAFYSAHLELFLGNGCLGVGVLMLLVLTIERYVSVCHPGHIRRICPPKVTVALIPVLTFLIYLPSVLRGEIVKCVLQSDGTIMYHKRDNMKFLDSLFYAIYKVILEIVFKLAPTVLIAGFNLRIMIVYRRTCDKRRRMTLSRINTKDQHEDPRKFAEERRLMMLLGSTSLLFLICVSPMALLHVTLSPEHLSSYSFQLFRALANLMELMNYSLTFYIYCLFSEDFRNTLFRTIRWPWFEKPLYQRGTEEEKIRKFDIVKLQEVCWKDSRIRTFQDGHAIYRSCGNTHELGTTFIVMGKMTKRMIECIINVYSPHLGSPGDDKYEIYAQQNMIVIGDFIAQSGQKEEFKSPIKRFNAL
ncbi:probable G-protein coupled receptor B0563.6 [Uranotaenia lowii]|uniref:probable G-protein coupled receptor B0563.6 n=1 Tax=Uranotaenia lowii TaxID=190385 RepID=UPI002478F022|nr:probable G-protein coupled receptor B0563.6 [Uranotaenia lowii]